MNRRPLLTITLILAALALLPVLAGCGDTKGTISPDQYSQLNKGMSLDDVEAILGAPERTHRMGSGETATIYWYYRKTEGEGLVKVTFEGGKVSSISPYDQSLSPDEY